MRKEWAIVLLWFAPLVLCSQSREKTVVSGVVVNSKTGTPISGALVVLAGFDVEDPEKPHQQPAPQRALSDGVGHFSFTVPGQFTGEVSASRQGFRSEEGYGKASAQVLAGETNATTLRLTPLGVLHGRVVNRDGEPLPGLMVRLIQLKMTDGHGDPQQFARTMTDDRGEYRLWHIFPGAYYLELAGKNEAAWNAGSVPNLPKSEEVYGPLLYPSSETLEQAQLLRLGAGEEVTADFVATGQTGYSINGVLKVPGSVATIRLLRGDNVVGQRLGINSLNGEFQLFDVVPGTYTLQAYIKHDDGLYFAEQPVEVKGKDVSGVVLTLNLPVEVRGSVEFLDGDDSQPQTGNRRNRRFMRIRAIPRSAAKLVPGLPPTQQAVSPTGEFTLKLVPGAYDIVTSGSHYPVSIQWNNVDVIRDGLTFAAGDAPVLQITVRAGGGSIQGTIEGIPDGSEKAVSVLLICRSGEHFDVQQINAAGGRFVAATLAPGEYSLVAFSSEREVEYRNPAVLQQLCANAPIISLRDGAKESVSVKLLPEDKP